MGFRAFTLLMLLFLSSAAVVCFQVAMVKANAGIIRVPEDFATIQEAIDAAQNGSTILVNSGVYHEHLTIDKTLTLLGAEKEDTIIDGSGGVDVINVTADNVLINGFTVRNGVFGVRLLHSYNSTVKGNIVTANGAWGIVLDSSYCSAVSDNIVSFTGSLPPVDLAAGTGIDIEEESANNTISDNIITKSAVWGLIVESDNNTIFNNVIQDNTRGISIGASNNTIFHNNLLNNQEQMVDEAPLSNFDIWNSSGQGNYWSDYSGLDDGSDGRVAGDGVGDTDLPWHGVDSCPMINPVNPVRIFWDNEAFSASFLSNNTIFAFSFLQAGRKIAFNTIGPANTTGYFNMSMPTSLLSGPWTVLLDGADVTSKATITGNQTHTSIYLNYSHSTHSIQIIGTNVIPEYPAASILLLILLTLPPPILVARKRKRTPNKC